MKKSCKLLCTMSKLSLLFSFITWFIFLDALLHYFRLNSIETNGDNAIFALVRGANDATMIVFGSIFTTTLLLGVSGLISSLKNGRFSILCIILAFPPLAFIFYVVIGYLLDKDDRFGYALMIFTFLVLYTAGAVTAFRGRKPNAETGNPIPSD